MKITSASTISKFDLNLRTQSSGHILEQHLTNFSAKPIYSNISLCNILPSTINSQKLKFQFEIKILDGILFSGVSTLQYSPVPEEYKLMQPYPNPFNPIATMEYALENNSEIILSAYDIQGWVVTYWAKGHKSTGYYQTVWDGSKYSSGMYIIQNINCSLIKSRK